MTQIDIDEHISQRVLAGTWDALIVGAGPAGLFAALALAATTSQRILLIDAGPDIEERKSRRASDNGGRGEDYIRGVGGAGLYSDGKLCLSLDVGGRLRAELSRDDKQRLLATITEVFQAIIGDSSIDAAPSEQIQRAQSEAEAVGLQFKYYPVLHIGTERCTDVIETIRQAVTRAGVTVVSNCELTALRVVAPAALKMAKLRWSGVDHTVLANHVVLSLGKVGAAQQCQFCREMDIEISSRPMYIGLRLEIDATVLAPLFALAKDPKYSLVFPDGSKMKTHCASDNGQVLRLTYETLPLAGGHSFHNAQTGRSGFSLLWDGLQCSGDSYQRALDLMRASAVYTNHQLLVQTLEDYRRQRPSCGEIIRHIPLTNDDCVPGDVRRVLPFEYFSHLEAFLDRFAKLVPGFHTGNAVFYAPAIEWWMNQIEVQNGNLETTQPGVYVCGDGSGWSQGIVHSAATGLLVAEGLAGTPVSAPHLVRQVLVPHSARQ